jgi:hypothetical protein
MTRYDPNHPARPPEDGDPFIKAWRDEGQEAPWLLAWKDAHVMVDAETGRYLYSHEAPSQGGERSGRSGRR